MPDELLEIVEGPMSGEQIRLTRPLEIGRDPSCDITLDDEHVSRHHARIVPGSGGPSVEDLDSRNGTFVNGHQLHGAVRLQPGDQVVVGVSVLELRTAESVRRQPTAIRPKPQALAIAPQRPDYVPPELALPARSSRHRLDSLLDVRTKRRARLAPVGLLLIVVFAVLIFIQLR
jgi:pSer/pThr/pTyr-binding forkhead associated (FHA) protein